MYLKMCLVAFLVCISVTACSRSNPNSPEVVTQQLALYRQAIKNQKKDHQRVEREFARVEHYYDKHDALLAREEALMTTEEKLLKRQASDVDRFEKIMDTWQKQQVQYQHYLNELKR